MSRFILLYWIIYLSLAISMFDLNAFAGSIIENLEAREVRKKLYVMEMAGWIARYSYRNKTYYYAQHAQDPFDYAFKDGAENDSTRWKATVMPTLQEALKLPPHVKEIAALPRTADDNSADRSDSSSSQAGG